MRFAIEAQDVPLFRQTIRTWGLTSQVIQSIEECAELIYALTKAISTEANGEVNLYKVDFDNLADGIADVQIMLAQLVVGFTIQERVDKRLEFKLKRLELLLAHRLDRVDKPLNL